MARRNATQSPESSEDNTNEEQNMSTSTPEAAPAAESTATAESTENTEQTAADQAAPTEEELQALVDAVVSAAAEVAPLANEETGELTSEQMKPVVDAFLAIPGRQQKARNAAKDALLDKMKYNIDPTNEGANFITARAYVLMQDELNRTKAKASGGGLGRVSVPVDPTEAFVANAASLILSVKLAQAHFVPEGVDEGWASKVKELNESEAVQSDIQKLVDWKATVEAVDDDAETPDMPEVQPHVLAAWKQAAKAGKVRRTRAGGGGASTGVSSYSGPLRSVAKHIAEFAQAHEAGVYPISVVSNFTSEEYGSDHPSSGALSAHLFPKSGKKRETESYKAAMTADDKKGLEVL